MPKIAGSKRQVWAEQLRENIQYVMLKRHKTAKDVADYMGIDEKTFRKKLNDPQKFKGEDYITMAMLFNCSPSLLWAGKFQVPEIEIPPGL